MSFSLFALFDLLGDNSMCPPVSPIDRRIAELSAMEGIRREQEARIARRRVVIPTPEPTGNTSFDAWRTAELARIKEEAEAVPRSDDKFRKFLDELKQAKDAELFQDCQSYCAEAPAHK
jgi:hypothetical protein